MKTMAVRLYGKKDIRLEAFELPPIKDDEILARVCSDSICMSSYKAALQGADHKRVPNDIAQNPTMLGHELCGDIVEVGAAWRHKYQAGQRFTIQPALNYMGRLDAPGYSYRYCGGNATYIILPHEVMELDCLLRFDGEAYFMGSLAEPMSCIIGAYHAQYHTVNGVYVHEMGIREGGAAAILAGAGPMGLGAIDYAVHGGRRPRVLAVTDIDDARLKRAASIYTVEDAKAHGVELHYINTADMPDADAALRALSGGDGFDDIFVFAPVAPVVEQADRLLGRDGCLNFFAGPTDTGFSAKLNFYNVHYTSSHIVGTSGGNTDDLIEALDMMADGRLGPAGMITHIGGLNAAVHTTLNLPDIPGGKKLIYTQLSLPLTALDDLPRSADPLLRRVGEVVAAHNGLWCAEAERILLEGGTPIT